MLNEADTRRKLIDPKLYDSGWEEDQIRREIPIAPGKLIDEDGNRSKGKITDYILYFSPSFTIAVVEAKAEDKTSLDGMQQAKDYAEAMGVSFAYSTNGRDIEEFDFTANAQNSLKKFPTPNELLERYEEHFYHCTPAEIETNLMTQSYYHMPGGKSPWYFQDHAIRATINAILDGENRILLAMATGSGKTFAAFQLVWKLLKSGRFSRVLYLADRNFLKNQAYNEFAPFEDARTTIEEGKAPKTRDVYFSIYQAMYSGEEGKRLYQEYPSDFFDLIIVDECHRSGYGTWKEILDHFGDAVQLGMTATPKRSDNIDTYAYFGEPVFSYSMGQAIEDGFLAPFQIYRSFTNIDRDGLHIRDALYQGAEMFVPEEFTIRDIYTLENFEREIILPDRTEKICDHLANLLRTFGAMQKTIVFCVNMEHAAQVAKELQNRFSDMGYSNYAIRIVSEEPRAAEDYERFRDSHKKEPVIATTVDLLTTGVDIPSVFNVVFLKSVNSKGYFKQHIGRGCRVDPITKKYFFRIIDYVNATRLLDEWDYPSGAEPSKVVEGPFDLSLRGFLVDHEDQSPISEARVSAQVAPNMQRMDRTDENGFFTLSQLPHSPITIQVSKSSFRSRQVTIAPTEEQREIVIELKHEKPPRKKIMLRGVEVHIAEETRIMFTATGKTLSDAEYVEYSRKGFMSRVANLDDLHKIWRNNEERKMFLDALKEESIFPELLANIQKMPDADGFDVIAHAAFGAPILTREERATAFVNKKATFLNALGDKARDVILSLLDKYRIGGIDQVSKPKVFSTPPFDRMGFLPGVAEIFGGIDELKEALDEVQSGLYG